ncbi:hypothetical protein BT69DRAFT_824187 [Atractiella rhizophila]|nr:hypothetical protein BT69DRAFT_824187 [Atractiella rhizophila]
MPVIMPFNRLSLSLSPIPPFHLLYQSVILAWIAVFLSGSVLDDCTSLSSSLLLPLHPPSPSHVLTIEQNCHATHAFADGLCSTYDPLRHTRQVPSLNTDILEASYTYTGRPKSIDSP